MHRKSTAGPYYGAVAGKSRELIAEGESQADAILVALGLVTPPADVPDTEPTAVEIARVSEMLRAPVDVDAVLTAYVECALWSTTDESDETGGEPLDANYGPDDLALETLAAMRAEVEAFLSSVELREALGFWADDLGEAQIGHDLWLTRNGHGAGFWDRFATGDGERHGRLLAGAAKPFSEAHLYIGDDGQIWRS